MGTEFAEMKNSGLIGFETAPAGLGRAAIGSF